MTIEDVFCDRITVYWWLVTDSSDNDADEPEKHLLEVVAIIESNYAYMYMSLCDTFCRRRANYKECQFNRKYCVLASVFCSEKTIICIDCMRSSQKWVFDTNQNPTLRAADWLTQF